MRCGARISCDSFDDRTKNYQKQRDIWGVLAVCALQKMDVARRDDKGYNVEESKR
jgi:hypothetical protein